VTQMLLHRSAERRTSLVGAVFVLKATDQHPLSTGHVLAATYSSLS
jgi:hypothetical protein